VDAREAEGADRRVKRHRRVIAIVATLAAAVLATWLLRNVPVTGHFKVDGVRAVSIYDGEFTLVQGDEPDLRVTAPLGYWPLLMVRRTGIALEIGQFDDGDIRVFLPMVRFASPAGAEPVWRMTLPEVDRVHAYGASGTAFIDGYRGDRLEVGGHGHAIVRDVDVRELLLWSQPEGTITASGRAEVLSQIDCDGKIDVSELDYRVEDRSLVEQVLTAD
jgi:hypothetical protein